MLMKKIHAQPSPSTIGPPISQAVVAPMPPSAPQIPSALLRSAPSSKVVVMIESADGVITAAPTPWKARAPISALSDQASPHKSEANVNNTTPTMNTRRRPSRSAARPPSSNRPANVSAYALTTHCNPCAETSSSFSIDGSATVTIAASRITMKNAPHNNANAHQRRGSGAVRGAVSLMWPLEGSFLSRTRRTVRLTSRLPRAPPAEPRNHGVATSSRPGWSRTWTSFTCRSCPRWVRASITCDVRHRSPTGNPPPAGYRHRDLPTRPRHAIRGLGAASQLYRDRRGKTEPRAPDRASAGWLGIAYLQPRRLERLPARTAAP